jgi:hypothetical protein
MVEEMRQNLEGRLNPGLLGLEPVKFYHQLNEGDFPHLFFLVLSIKKKIADFSR